MGLGDEIMATAQARMVAQTLGVKADFGEWSKLYKDNPHIAPPGRGFPVRNRTGDRPYILGQTDKQVVFNPNFRALPGDIYLTNNEEKEARKLVTKAVGNEPFILVQPEVKTTFSRGNKAWPMAHWKALVRDLKTLDIPLLQMIKDDREGQRLCKTVVTHTFRVACAVVKRSMLLICSEGGLHHAAAALDKPAVVLWTGFSHPWILGYATHLNLRYDNSPPCGMKVECDHCKRMAEKLTPDTVFAEIRKYLDQLPTPVHQG